MGVQLRTRNSDLVIGGTPAWDALERRLLSGPPPLPFRGLDLDGAPEPVRRYFAAAIGHGTPLAEGARFRMRGRIKLGRWLPFRSRQLLAPCHGTVWVARVGGVMAGSDHYLDGTGGMRWRLAGLVPLMHAEGEDVSRSARGRAAGESIWVPTALAHSSEVRALDEDRIAIDVPIGDETITVEHTLAQDGRVLSSVTQRWGDPEGSGEWRRYPFGIQVTAWRTFGGVTIPSAGRAGWHYGTGGWEQGEFFRYEITDYQLVAGVSARL